ncbi:MAG: IclR family transcriptional regulator [Candidatus Dormibacteraeota bacterium]|nr:IclR family transcriptional regulator [Candidatus Dormibacteraeota bacterium]
MNPARTEPHVGNGTTPPYVRVIGKAVAALDALLDGSAELTSTELARRLGMSRSTVHRLLTTMEHHRLVDRTETGAYGLGIHLFRLGSAVPVRAVLGRLAEPALAALAERFAVSSYLSVRDGERALCIARIDRGPVKTTTYQVGETLPVHLGAGPNILMSELPAAELDRILARPVLAMTPHTMVDPGAIRSRLAMIRDTGLAYAPDDVEVGLAAMGVAVRDRSRELVGAVSVVALTPWFSGEHYAAIATGLRETAALVEAELGPKAVPA